MDTEKVFCFMRLLHEFQNVERTIPVLEHPDRQENDAEHSYSLAMLAWYLADSLRLDLDTPLVLKYALIHDLVEVYAGDTPAFTSSLEHKESKRKREADAQARLAREFPEFGELHKLLERYEAREDSESRFVYALDKVVPAITGILNNGNGKFGFKDQRLTLALVLERHNSRANTHRDAALLWNKVRKILAEREEELFGNAE